LRTPSTFPPAWQDKEIIVSALKTAYKDNPALAEKAEFLEKVVQVGCAVLNCGAHFVGFVGQHR
jgi:hypothetical protein